MSTDSTVTPDRGELSTSIPEDNQGTWTPRTGTIVSAVLITAAVGSLIGLFLVEGRETKGLLALAAMLALLFLRVPVGVAIGLAGLAGITAISGASALSNAAGLIPFSAASGWSLSVIPLFILMGLLLWRSGATDRIYAATKVWFGWVPGGVAVTTNVAGAGLGAVSGSTLGITYALSRLGVPEMIRSGYDTRLATGSVLVAGLAGQLIPPSVILVIYAGIANTPVGPQLISGILPGIALAAVFCITIIVISAFLPNSAATPRQTGLPLAEKLSITAKSLPIGLLVVIVVGGIYTGTFTATEAGAFGALTATVLAVFFTKRRFPGVFVAAVKDTASACGGIFLMVISANFLSRMMATSGLTFKFNEFVSGLEMGRVSMLLLLLVFYLILGMFLEPLTMMLLTVPLLLPILTGLDVSPLWFGVFVVLLCELSIVTPPVGVLTFVVHKVVQHPEVSLGTRISLNRVFAGAMYFIPSAVILLILMIFFPGLVEWLPELSSAE